jgi:prepilin-type N-terminal cleavage/methylation domain-containing protein
MICNRQRKGGFSLVELSVATALLVIGLAFGIRGLVYFLNESRESESQDNLDIGVQTAMERIKYDLRLSTLDQIYYSPAGSASFKAISFPMARDDDKDGALEIDSKGKIIWDRTMIYHVWSGTPNRLLLTIFDPRDNTLTPAQFQAQVDTVLATGSGTTAVGGNRAKTYTVFENLFNWNLRPIASVYDAYSSETERDTQAYFGSALLTPGYHKLLFKTIGKNASSSNYRIGLDTLALSSSYSSHEAEKLLPVVTQSGATAAATYMAGGSWSGNYHLYFPSTAVGQYFQVQIYNDEWVEENFAGMGQTHERTQVLFDQALSPYDYTVQLRGMDWNWEATRQSSDTSGRSGGRNEVRDTAVRVLIRGAGMAEGGSIAFEGAKTWVGFYAGWSNNASLHIKEAYIAECASSTNASMNAMPGTSIPILYGGSKEFTVAHGTMLWTDLGNMTLKPKKNYLVSYRVSNDFDEGCPMKWVQPTGMVGSYTVAVTGTVPTSVVSDNIWSTRSDVQTQDAILGIYSLYSTYPTNGVYTSTIFDTQTASPNYSAFEWSASTLNGTSLRMKARAGNNADLSGATAWSNVTAAAMSGPSFGGTGRYVQFQATLLSDATRYNTPKLQSATIRWPGESRVVNVGGTVTKGPDYSIFQAELDGLPLKSGILLDLEIYKDVRIHGAVKRITSALSTEVMPRNTGH